MKRTALLSFIFCLMMSLYGEAQTVTISVKNAKLENVLKEFRKQTGYSFFYDEALRMKAQKVTLNLKNAPLSEALNICFINQPLLSYSIDGKIVAITEKIQSAAQSNANAGMPLPPSGIMLKGFVYNKDFQPLANASVMIKGKNQGTSTTANGSFSLDNVEPTDILVASFIGYKPVELKVGDRQDMSFVLEEATSQLDEVVAKGYSNTTKRFSTSTVNKIRGEEIARQPVMNPLLALQGRVPGMLVTPSSGVAAAPVKVEIRGRSLLSGVSSTPLIVIDGTPLPLNTSLPPGMGVGAGAPFGDGPIQGVLAYVSPAGSQSPLFGLNPRDIESIEVLKDVGAAAIYGSNGANGVILITTKRGKPGASGVDLYMNYGISKVTRYLDLLNTQQYLDMRRQAFKNDGITPTPQNAPDLLVWDTTRYVDWQKEIYGKTGKAFDANISVYGGVPQFSHRIAAGYSSTDDIMNAGGKNEAINLEISLDHKSTNQKFSANFSAKYFHTISRMRMLPDVASLPPNAPPIFNEEGQLNFKPWNDAGLGAMFTSFEFVAKPIETKTHNLISNLKLGYQLMKGLNFVANLGYTRSSADGLMLDPMSSQNPNNFRMGSSSIMKGQNTGITFEPTLNFETWFGGKGRFSIVTGATVKQSSVDNIMIDAMGFTDDELLRAIALAPFKNISNTYSQYKYAGVFTALSFRWDNKYVIELNGRRDGSSRFGPGYRYGNFGSVGLAWIASEEPWMQKILSPVIGFLKFNVNAGTTGQDGGADYQYLSQWSKPNGLPQYDGRTPMVNMHAVNQDYHWQRNKEFNVGMDMLLLKNDQINVSVNYYRKRVGNQLVNNPTPAFTGFPSVYGNWDATIQNEGWEFSAGAMIIKNKRFSWNMRFNGSINKNKLIAFPGIQYTPYYNQMLVGRSTTAKYMFNYLGVDPLTGLYQFEDYNKDGDISTNASTTPLAGSTDNQRMVDLNPLLAGGIGQSFTYRDFSLSLSFDYRIQKGTNVFSSIPNPGAFGNIPLEIYENHWQQTGDMARYAKFTTTTPGKQGYKTSSTFVITDASYLRLNNLSFSYSLPERIAKKLFMKRVDLSIVAQDLFVITKYKGIDPVAQNFKYMPPAKIIKAGFNISF